MYLNRKYFHLALFVVATGIHTLSSQDIKKDITAINTAYNKLGKLSCIFELNMYENYTTSKIYYTQSGTIQKNGNATFQKFDDTECINTPDYSVIIDKEDKEVVYAPKKRSFTPSVVSLNLDSVLMFCKSNKYRKISDNLCSYEFTMIDRYPDYNQIVVFFNPSNYLIQKIVFYCEEDDISVNNDSERLAKSRLEINYRNIDTKPSFNASDFSYERYLDKSGNKFVLKSSLKDYHLTVLSF